MSEAMCKICHQRPVREGRQVCDVCLGFERGDSVDQSIDNPMDQTPQPSIEQEQPAAPIEGACNTCGASFEPYKLGSNMIKKGICQTCLMRKKYGPDWVPGGKSKRPEYQAEASRRHRVKKKLQENGNGTEVNPEVDSPLSCNPDPSAHEEAVAMLDSIRAGQQEQAILATTPSGLLAIKGIKNITIPFEYPEDEALYDRILSICKKERRTPEAQILFWLDRVVEV